GGRQYRPCENTSIFNRLIGIHGGGSGIRARDTLLTYARFPSVCLQPLGHPSSGVHLQCGKERRLRDLHLAELAHALLALLLFFQELALARDVAAIALRRHVLG